MTKLAPLGLKRLEGVHYYVRDLERSRAFYVGKLDFAETWRSSAELEQRTGQRSACFSAGTISVVCSAPIAGAAQSARAARFLAKHPDGVDLGAAAAEPGPAALLVHVERADQRARAVVDQVVAGELDQLDVERVEQLDVAVARAEHQWLALSD